MSQPEDKTKQAVKKMLASLDTTVFQFMPSAAYGGRKGIPDHIACMKVEITEDMVGKELGLFVGIESKAEGGKLHGLQPLTIAKIIEAGGIAQVAYNPADAERIRKSLEEYLK